MVRARSLVLVTTKGGEGGEEVGQGVGGGVQGPAGRVGDDEVVHGDVEGLGDANDGVQAGGELAAFVAGDLPGVGVDLVGEVGLGPAGLGAQLAQAVGLERGAPTTRAPVRLSLSVQRRRLGRPGRAAGRGAPRGEATDRRRLRCAVPARVR